MKSEVNTPGESFTLARVFNAPRSDVFRWWAEAERLQQWSGCKEATKCEVAMDFRVGGSFTQTMQISVRGKQCEFSFVGVYQKITVPERISYRADLGQVRRNTRDSVRAGVLGCLIRTNTRGKGTPSI